MKKGSSGSPRHTEHRSDGRDLGGAGRGAERGPSIGPGVMGRVMTPEYDRNRSENGRNGAPGKPGRPYTEE